MTPKTDAIRTVKAARIRRGTTSRRHKQERFALLAREFGAEQARGDQFGMRTVNPHRNARDALTRAFLARAEADQLRNLPVAEAARRINANRAEQEQARQRAQQNDPFERGSHRTDRGREGPARAL